MPATSQAQFEYFKGVCEGRYPPPKGMTREQCCEYVKDQSPKGLPEKAAHGKVVGGPALVQVGEKGPEYLLAPPGAIVAPMRKGEKATMAGGLKAVLEQLFKSLPAKAQEGATVDQGLADRWQAMKEKRTQHQARPTMAGAPTADQMAGMEAQRRRMLAAAATRAAYTPTIQPSGISGARRAAYMGQRNQPAPTKATLARSRPAATEPNMGFRTDLSDWENINFRNWLERQAMTQGRPQAQTDWINAMLNRLGPRPIFAAQGGATFGRGGGFGKIGFGGAGFGSAKATQPSAEPTAPTLPPEFMQIPFLRDLMGGKRTSLLQQMIGTTQPFGEGVQMPNWQGMNYYDYLKDPQYQQQMLQAIASAFGMPPEQAVEQMRRATGITLGTPLERGFVPTMR